MNYPVWETTVIGGPTLIAVIAVLHVYISHLAVGGGLFLWLTDLKAWRENDDRIHAYLRKHIWFFLLLTMVFGGISGVGIWFIIALVSPSGTNLLIHNFVFGWAIEWVFFLGEIVSLLIYHYKFDSLGRTARLRISFLYFLFAWLSLFVINGIIDFMLTPGGWLASGNFWDGFFNPTYFPSLFFRSFICFTFAGLFGYVTTVFLAEEAFRRRMLVYCTKWLLWPVAGLVPSALWYFYAVPPAVRDVAFGQNAATTLPLLDKLYLTTALFFLFGILLSVMKSRSVQKLAAFLLLPIGLVWMGAFEYTREISRKPFVIYGYMYSNSILKADVQKLDSEGFLANARWTAVREVTDNNRLEAGRELFNLQCLSCHTVGGLRMDILPRSARYGYQGLIAQISGQGKVMRYMPPFVGTQAEKEALAEYIWTRLLGREIPAAPSRPAGVKPPGTVEIPPFDRNKDQYVLLAWNEQGMQCISDCDEMFSFLPPANTLEAQLIRRAQQPVLVPGEEVELSYEVEPQHADPAKHLPFWDFAAQNYGAALQRNVGLAGKGVPSGTFDWDTTADIFVAKSIPLAPYREDGTFNAYPLVTVEAREKSSGKVLARTRVVAPVSTETGCYRCHGGEPRKLGAGISTETAANILAVHDRHHGTTLLADASAGNPRLCQSCHPDAALGQEGQPGVLNLSAAMHGWHANYMTGLGDQSCMYCHPVAFDGLTRSVRGVHGGGDRQVVCSKCHGGLDDLASGLLVKEKDKPYALRLAANLAPTVPADQIPPRTPWLENPDCFACHVDFQQPGPAASSVNKWNQTPGELYRLYNDNTLIRCAGCHGSPHAIFPALNPHDRFRDVIQPMQYQGQPFAIGANKNCFVCHLTDMTDPIHHENMWREVREKGGFDEF